MTNETFYNHCLVDEPAKSKLLTMFSEYNPLGILGILGGIFYNLLKTHNSKDLDLQAHDLTYIANLFPSYDNIVVNYYLLLADKAKVTSERVRLPTGSKEVEFENHYHWVAQELAPLRDPVKLNTWAAISEGWLQVFNIERLQDHYRELQEQYQNKVTPFEQFFEDSLPSPEDEEELIRYDLKLTGYMTLL